MINWAVIGTGNVANLFAKEFDNDEAQIYAVFSRNLEKGQDYAKAYGVEKVYDDYEELLGDENIDIIYVATPHNTHYPYIKKGLEAGKHVLAEKVIVLNSDQLKVCMDLAKKNNLILAEAMTSHYMPLYQEIHDWIKSKDLGPLKMIQVNFGSYKNYEDRYFFKKELAGGALFDIGVYALNFVRQFMSSKPDEIKTMVNFHESGVDESSAIIMRNKEDEMATLSITFRAKMPKRAVVAYEEGYVEIYEYPNANKANLVRPSGESEALEVGRDDIRFKYEVDHFTQLIKDKGKNENIQYTLDVLEIMDYLRNEWGLKYDNEEI